MDAAAYMALEQGCKAQLTCMATSVTKSLSQTECINKKNMKIAVRLVAPSAGWMLHYLCDTNLTAIEPFLRQGGSIMRPHLTSTSPPLSKPLDSGAVVSDNPLKTNMKRKCDRGCNSRPPPWPWLNSQPQRFTKPTPDSEVLSSQSEAPAHWTLPSLLTAQTRHMPPLGGTTTSSCLMGLDYLADQNARFRAQDASDSNSASAKD